MGGESTVTIRTGRWELWGGWPVGGMAGLGRRGMLSLIAVMMLAACTSTEKSADSAKVRTDLEPLERRFAALGPLSGAHWLGTALGTDSRVSVPGPTDVRVVGTAQLRAGAVAAITGARHRSFQPDTPSRLPPELAEFMPTGARWVRSNALDREMTGGTYFGTFYLDPGTDTVYFDTTNPNVSASSGP
ncbi:hypothetical protein GCM10011579_086730 [Streptomyces albiflavescens]|uniref:Uncharacterized protein n=1 Tax=Streptomyces albiflavescens TaxID=1623582 RepID=A0A917YD58_9ACTN|nr:hypothetical protein GCM10011579_086730 [Streptomyces albiflavescens]